MKRYWRYIVGGVFLLAAAVTTFFIFYHPPMRLMPAPLLFQGAGLEAADVAPALTQGQTIDVFYATNRLPIGPRDARIYTVAPDRRLYLGRAEMRIGDEGTSLGQIYEWTTGAERSDRPFIHLTRMVEYAGLAVPDDPTAIVADDPSEWLSEINALLAQSRHKNILVYVHGANTTVERAAGQASMLRHFTGRNAVVVLFAWPTAENFLRYPRDIQNAYGASPRLAELIELLAAKTDAENIDVFTYSAGGTVGSDGLAVLANTAPEAAKRLGEVIHAAPDADFASFVDDLAIYADDAERVTTAVNLGDSALRLAGIVNRGSRAGRPDLSELSPEAADFLFDAVRDYGMGVLQVHPENMSDMPSTSHTFWYDDPWVSNDVIVTLLFNLTPAERQLEKGEVGGTAYWTFPPDYPDRMPALRKLILSKLSDP